MPLITYEDVLELTVRQLADFLSVRGLTSERKIKLVARAFAAMKLNMNIIATTEQQQKQLKETYHQKLSDLKIPDQNGIPQEKRKDDVTKWPLITLGNVFA